MLKNEQPLECWVPKEFSDAWEDYVEYYCWVSGTYHHDVHKELLSLTSEQRMRTPVTYYQWVPYFMLVQAVLFWAPCVLWKLLAGSSNLPIASLLRVASNSAFDDDEQRDRAAAYIARSLMDLLAQRPRVHAARAVRPRSATGRSGCGIVAMYFLLKLLLIVHVALELYFTIVFTNANGAFYGTFQINRN